MREVDFYFFSGTGNTLLVVKEMTKVFKERGIQVTLHRLEKMNPLEVNLNRVIGLAFPVAVQGTYPFIWRFIESLPEADNTEVFMVDTLAYQSGGVEGVIKHILTRKGYRPIAFREIIMPSNLLPRRINAEKNKGKIRKGLEEARRYATDILEGRGRWRDDPVSILISKISRSEKTWKLFRRMISFKVDTDKCSNCKLCIQLCPMGNISWNKYPVFDDKCVFCMRCISMCPTRAIHVPGKKIERYHAVTPMELLNPTV